MSATNQSTEEQWAQDASDVLTQEQVDAIDASEDCIVNKKVNTKYQEILHKYLEGLCEDNDVPVFQQWEMYDTRKFGDYGHPDDERKFCRCSHWIRDEFTIVNVFNGKIAHPIGSVCIQRWFSGNDILEQLAVLKKDKKMSKESRYPCVVVGCNRYSDCTAKWRVCSMCESAVQKAKASKLRYGKFKGLTWEEVWTQKSWWCRWAIERDFMKERWHKYTSAYLRAMMKAEPTIKLN